MQQSMVCMRCHRTSGVRKSVFFTMFYHVLTSKVFLGELTTKMDDSFSVTLRSSYFTPVVSIHYGKFSLTLSYRGGLPLPMFFFVSFK